MSTKAIKNGLVSVDAIAPHERNFRSHPDTQLVQLEASHNRFGQFRSIVLWQRPGGQYVTVAGHGILEAMKRNGVTEVRADILPIETPQSTIDAILIADNKLSSQATDDDTLLAALLQEQADAGFDLASLGTDAEELRQMLEALGDEMLGGGGNGDGGDEFDVTPEEGPTRTHVGELWQLGEHRLFVGDCTNSGTIDYLTQGEVIDAIISDPPYGIDVVGTDGRIGLAAKFGRIVGDMKPFDPRYWLDMAEEVVLWGANHYADKLPSSPCWLVWDKRDGDRHNDFADCELAWCKKKGVVRIFSHLWMGYSRASERGIPREHPTQKPIVVMEWVIEERTSEGALILDPYAGSGTTLIACEHKGRLAFLCEIDPRYADVILRRYEAETGQTATLLERAEAVPHA